MIDFVAFPKIARYSRECVITEKLDGTNAQVTITEYGDMLFGSRTRWITPEDDNYGFARWATGNKDELMKLGPGSHFGEWWGQGIQCGYGLKEKRFSLFNTARWTDWHPECCHVVPVIVSGMFCSELVSTAMERLRTLGSVAAPGYMHPEGIIIWHDAAQMMFKKTLHKDESPKGKK